MSNFESMLFADLLRSKMMNIAMSKTFDQYDAEENRNEKKHCTFK